MNSKIILGFSLVLSFGFLGCSTNDNHSNSSAAMKETQTPPVNNPWQATLRFAINCGNPLLVPFGSPGVMNYTVPAEAAKILESLPANELLPFLMKLRAEPPSWKAGIVDTWIVIVRNGLHGTPTIITNSMTLGKGAFASSRKLSVYSYADDYLKRRNRANTTAALQNILKEIEQQIPELKSVNIQGGALPTTSDAIWWHGEEYATAGFVLAKNTRYHPAGEFPPQTTPIPYVDLSVIITRYASADDAQKDLETSLHQRPAATPPKESYKGNLLYRYASGGGTAICQAGLYIVEINCRSERAIPLTMKVLAVVLAGLNP